MDELKLKRFTAHTQMLHVSEFFKTFNLTSTTVHDIEAKLKRLGESQTEFIQNQKEIEASTTTNDELKSQLKERLKFQDEYDAIESKLNLMMAQVKKASAASTPVGPISGIKLPLLDLPKFNGTYQEWTSFHDLFVASIHNNSSLSGAQKFQYLKSAVSGDAAILLRSLPTTDASYKEAWTILTSRYENKRHIIFSHLNSLCSQPALTSESANDLRSLLDTSVENVRSLQVMGQNTEHWDSILVFLLSGKLDAESRKQWELSVTTSDVPTYTQFAKFLETRCRALESIDLNQHKSKAKNEPAKQQKSKVNGSLSYHSSSSKPQDAHCPVCKESHLVHNCPTYVNASISKKFEIVKQFNLCYNCLRPGHNTQKCRSTGTCRTCKKNHHSTLHRESITSTLTATPSTATDSTPAVTSNHSSGGATRKHSILPTGIIQVQNSRGEYELGRALLDVGSEAHLVSEPCIQRLGTKRRRTHVPINGLSATRVGTANGMATLHLKSCHSSFSATIDALIMPKLTNNLPTCSVRSDSLSYLQHLKLADPNFHKSSPIDIILGADLFFKLLLPGKIEGPEGCPDAQNSVLGWLIAGKVENNSPPPSVMCNHYTVDLDDQLKKFWEIEEMNKTHPQSVEERQCESHFESTVQRSSTGKFIVELPLKEDTAPLGPSRELAVRNFESLERRLQRKPECQRQYREFMNEYESLGHMSLLTEAEVSAGNNDICYFPHHYVEKESSSTTKFRVVFHASFKTASGVSLNDRLIAGPTIQDDLMSILMRFRTHRYAFTSDIAKMYRQIEVNSKHQDLQRIVWRKSPNEQLKDYKLLTVTYGTASAPYQATKCLQHLAVEEKKNFPLASPVLLRDFYVDDGMTGADTLEEGIELQSQLVQLLEKGCFHLRKWSANHPKLLENIPEEDREVKQSLCFTEEDSVKTLGLHWFPSQDYFSFTVNLPKVPDSLTKRGLISDVSKLFDPPGFFAPCIIIPKCLFQRLWLIGLSWDEPLSPAISQEWMEFRNQLFELEKIKIDRWHKTLSTGTDYQLHGFSDASSIAYSAVVYIRVNTPSGVNISLIAAKTKVAPVKTISIPRLELCGALLLSRLTVKVKSALNLQLNETFTWTDSTIVLDQLKGHPNRWKTFVANRVTEVQDLVPTSNWRYVPSEDNPADCASRGVNPADLMNHPLWWKGPKWLSQDPKVWPSLPSVPIDHSTSNELKKTLNVCATMQVDVSLLHRFSSLTHLTRVTALCVRFIHNLKHPYDERKFGRLTAVELHHALHLWINNVQSMEFTQEIECCQTGDELHRKSRLLCLKPFVDSSGLLRVGGRLNQSNVAYDKMHPIILPRSHHLTDLIVSNCHLSNLHAGAQLMLGLLRNRYWILCARVVIKRHIHKCVRCYRFRSTTMQPIMGNLPKCRTEPNRPFFHSGVDYAGPFIIKMAPGRCKRRTKGYVAVFVCMVTKAIHLELVSNLSTDSFIAALKRFVSRRGKGGHIYSDNGTNFVGAKTELADLKKLAISSSHNDHISKYLATDGITWHLNPPAAPHFGGLWEAGVKSMKHHLRRVVGSTILTFEELTTILTQVEACLNSRPLCPMSSSPDDLDVLTPGHFLIGEALNAIPEPDLTHLPMSRLSRWQLMQQLLQHFWTRWHTEYLSNLQQLPKWTRKDSSIQVGDLVLLKDELLPPIKWNMARVIAIHPGKDCDSCCKC